MRVVVLMYDLTDLVYIDLFLELLALFLLLIVGLLLMVAVHLVNIQHLRNVCFINN